MTMCVSALALTSLDSVARIGRMSFQELFSTDDMEQAEHWRQVVCNKYFATMITLACGFILTKIGYSNIWPLFGSAVFMVEGLQLIIAALLMVLGVIIVYTSGRELFRKKEVREKSVGKTGIQAGA